MLTVYHAISDTEWIFSDIPAERALYSVFCEQTKQSSLLHNENCFSEFKKRLTYGKSSVAYGNYFTTI